MASSRVRFLDEFKLGETNFLVHAARTEESPSGPPHHFVEFAVEMDHWFSEGPTEWIGLSLRMSGGQTIHIHLKSPLSGFLLGWGDDIAPFLHTPSGYPPVSRKGLHIIHQVLSSEFPKYLEEPVLKVNRSNNIFRGPLSGDLVPLATARREVKSLLAGASPERLRAMSDTMFPSRSLTPNQVVEAVLEGRFAILG